MDFLTFDKEHPKVWARRAEAYFAHYSIPDHLKVRTAISYFTDQDSFD